MKMNGSFRKTMVLQRCMRDTDDIERDLPHERR
jgi:predicted Rdx family selenoprotein